jgi:hypothetical protein
MPNKRRKAEAINKLRSLAIFESTLNGNTLQPSDQKLIEITEKVKDDEPWETIFPNVASVKFASEETEHNLSLKLTKKDGLPIHLVPEGTPDATAIATRRVNELDYYNLGHKKLSEKVGLTSPKLTALVKYLGLKKTLNTQV